MPRAYSTWRATSAAPSGWRCSAVFIDRRVESHADAIPRKRERQLGTGELDTIASQGRHVRCASSGDLAYGQQQAVASIAGQIHHRPWS